MNKIIKISILVIISTILQIYSNYWFSGLIISIFIGLKSDTINDILVKATVVAAIPWLSIFIMNFNAGNLLFIRISDLFGLNHYIILIILSLFFISALSILISVSSFLIKKIIND